jgi:hypothetical protein
MRALIPQKDTAPFTLYVNGFLTGYPAFVEGRGYYVNVRGPAALFYTYRKHRQAYFVLEGGSGPQSDLPDILTPVRIIFRAKGRKVDLLKRLMYICRKEFGDRAFTFGDEFWMRATALIDIGFNGKESMMNRDTVIETARRMEKIQDPSIII